MNRQRVRVQCNKCENRFWIISDEDDDLLAIPEGELFEHYCPYCHGPAWVQFPSEKEK